MNRTLWIAAAVAVSASTPAFAADHYLHCFGGGRLGLYYSNVFAAPQDAGAQKAKAFDAFVKAKYGTTISSRCQSDGSQANAASSKKIEEDSDQKSKFPSKLVETGWNGS